MKFHEPLISRFICIFIALVPGSSGLKELRTLSAPKYKNLNSIPSETQGPEVKINLTEFSWVDGK